VEERPKPVARTTRAARARRAEEAPAAPAATQRADVEDSEGEDEERRGRARERHRVRADEGGEKELRKALKHTKGKAPRLFDVLVTPGP